MRKCGTNLFPEYRNLFRKPPLRTLSVPDQDTRVIVPIVFHIVGNSSVQNLLTDNRIGAQVKQLNQDFSATNSDMGKVPGPFAPWLGDSAKISFEIKQIIRKSTSSTFQPPEGICQDPVKSSSLGGSSPVDTEKNLNVWCASLSELLGYSSLPWYREYGQCYVESDGVVMDYRTVGSISSPNPGGLSPYNLGRTATHEVGHYLGLMHMWNDCLDQGSQDCLETTVCCRSLEDLPAQKGCNYGKPTFPHRAGSCPASASSPPATYGDMFMNYMDYVDDDSMFMFSESQLSFAMDMCIQYRPSMVRQFRTTSTSTLNLSGLNKSKNSDLYKCVVINENGTVVLESDYVRATTN